MKSVAFPLISAVHESKNDSIMSKAVALCDDPSQTDYSRTPCRLKKLLFLTDKWFALLCNMKDIREIDEETLTYFRWPTIQEADGHYSDCRYLADFVLRDKNGVLIDDMFVKRTKSADSYIAKGTLLARPGSNRRSICDVEIPFVAYSIDFSEPGTASRGYWVESEVKGKRIYYKLVRPHSIYNDHATKMEEKLDNFLDFFDYLSSATHQNKFGFIECDQTIEELHLQSNGAFNLNFIKDDATLVLTNLVNSLQELKSAILIESIRILGKLDLKKTLVFFPTINLKSFLKALNDCQKKKMKSIASAERRLVHGRK